MPLFSPHNPKSQYQQPQSPAAAEKPAFQTVSENQTEAECHYTASPQMTFPAHKNTPCTLYAEGVVE